MGVRRLMVAGALLCATGGPAWSQTVPVTVKVSGRMQFQWNSTSVDAEETGSVTPIAASTFETRRVRVGVDVSVGDWITGYVEPDYALGRLSLKQVWMAFEIDPALKVRAGQFKKPFNVVQLSSSTQIPIIERSVRIRGLEPALVRAADGELSTLRTELLVGEMTALIERQGYDNYDMGVAAEGSRGPLGYSVGVFNGNGADARDENDGKSLAARVTWSVAAGTPLRLGAAWSRRELNTEAAAGGFKTYSGDAFEVDAELGGFRRGPWVIAQAAAGTNLATDAQFRGAAVIGSWFIPVSGGRIEGYEPAARVSWGDPDDVLSGDAGMLLTPGMNLYFFGRNRLMLNWDVYMPEGDRFETQHAARAQVNLHF